MKSLRLSCNNSITPSGWRSFFNSLQRNGTQLVKLDISHNRIGNEGIAALGSLLGSMSTLKTLRMSHMLYSRIDGGMEDSVTSQGWVTFFNSLQDSNLDLVKLYIDGNEIDDEGIRLLTRVVSGMNSFKMLVLNDNRLVSSTGWQALSAYLRSPNFVLEELHLDENKVNDDTVVAFFTNALIHNNTLESLYLYQNPDDDLIADRGWEAVSTLLCNKVSILDTYTSNHTLHKLGYDHDEMNLPDDLVLLLESNKNEDKAEVARQKILQTHFPTEDNDTSNIQEFLDMELNIMPAAIEWIGRRPMLIGKAQMYQDCLSCSI